MKISQITPDILASFLKLPSAVDLLATGVAATAGRMTVSDAIDLLQRSEIQLWAAVSGGAIQAIVLSEVTQYPRYRALKLFGLAGMDLGELSKLVPVLQAFGRDHGCPKIEIVDTRPGMGILPGARKTGVCFEISTAAEEIAA